MCESGEVKAGAEVRSEKEAGEKVTDEWKEGAWMGDRTMTLLVCWIFKYSFLSLTIFTANKLH